MIACGFLIFLFYRTPFTQAHVCTGPDAITTDGGSRCSFAKGSRCYPAVLARSTSSTTPGIAVQPYHLEATFAETWPAPTAVTLPTFKFNRPYFLDWVGSLCPLGTDVPALVEEIAGGSVMRRFEPGRNTSSRVVGFRACSPARAFWESRHRLG
jgi:hypothetical protein